MEWNSGCGESAAEKRPRDPNRAGPPAARRQGGCPGGGLGLPRGHMAGAEGRPGDAPAEVPPALGALRAHVRKAVGGPGSGWAAHRRVGSGPWGLTAWRGAVKGTFVDRRGDAGDQDDLLFLVKETAPAGTAGTGADEGGREGGDALVCRRITPRLDLRNEPRINWTESFYLNLVLQGSYSLTVAVCSQVALKEQRRAKGPMRPLFKVTHPVHASPSKTEVNVRTSKADKDPETSYPDICFAVHDYDDAFDRVRVDSPDHCLCVLLNVNARALSVLRDAPPEELERFKEKLCLFSGYVSHQQLKHAHREQKRGFLAGLVELKAKNSEKVVMRGPKGKGSAEVAVTQVVDEAEEAGRARRGNFFQKAIGAATSKAGVRIRGLGGDRAMDSDVLQCGLMEVRLPVFAIVKALILPH